TAGGSSGALIGGTSGMAGEVGMVTVGAFGGSGIAGPRAVSVDGVGTAGSATSSLGNMVGSGLPFSIGAFAGSVSGAVESPRSITRVVRLPARSAAVTCTLPSRTAAPGTRNTVGMSADATASGCQELSGAWYATRSVDQSGLASRIWHWRKRSPRMEPALAVTSGGVVSTTTAGCGGAVSTLAGEALPRRSTVTNVNRYSPSAGAR